MPRIKEMYRTKCGPLGGCAVVEVVDDYMVRIFCGPDNQVLLTAREWMDFKENAPAVIEK